MSEEDWEGVIIRNNIEEMEAEAEAEAEEKENKDGK